MIYYLLKFIGVAFKLKKPYPTPYVNGIREGIVKITHLIIEVQPWNFLLLQDGLKGFANSGEYEFNGTNTYIKVVDSNYFNMNDKITLSAWIKHKQTTE